MIILCNLIRINQLTQKNQNHCYENTLLMMQKSLTLIAFKKDLNILLGVAKRLMNSYPMYIGMLKNKFTINIISMLSTFLSISCINCSVFCKAIAKATIGNKLIKSIS